MVVFLLVPLVILIVNVLVMREVWHMSSSGPVAPSQSIKVSSVNHTCRCKRRSKIKFKKNNKNVKRRRSEKKH